jgi:hypothetical protein
VQEDPIQDDEDEDDSEVGEDEYAHTRMHMDRIELIMRQICR